MIKNCKLYLDCQLLEDQLKSNKYIIESDIYDMIDNQFIDKLEKRDDLKIIRFRLRYNDRCNYNNTLTITIELSIETELNNIQITNIILKYLKLSTPSIDNDDVYRLDLNMLNICFE